MNPKMLIPATMIFACIGIALFAAVVVEFDSSKRYDKTEVTDLVYALKVPVEKDGAIGPVVPDDLRELRKSQTVAYEFSEPVWSTYAIVIMIVPAEYKDEFLERVAKHQDVQLLAPGDVAALRNECADAEGKLAEMDMKVENALTPMPAFDIQ